MWGSDSLSLNLPLPYEVGDWIEYETFGGGRRTCRVTAKFPDVKNGEPGFDAVTEEDLATRNADGVWGYDSQIVRVLGPTR